MTFDAKPVCSPGVTGAARRERKALNTGDLVRCGWPPQPRQQGRKPSPWAGEESDESVVPLKATKAAGGKGLYLLVLPLWGRRGDCGNTSNST